MRFAGQLSEEIHDERRNLPAARKLPLEGPELALGRKLPPMEEEGRLLERGLRSQGVDVDPPVGEDAAVAVDRRDRALPGRNVPQAPAALHRLRHSSPFGRT